MRETNQTDKLGRSGEPDKQTKIVRRSNRQIRLFVSVCLVTTLLSIQCSSQCTESWALQWFVTTVAFSRVPKPMSLHNMCNYCDLDLANSIPWLKIHLPPTLSRGRKRVQPAINCTPHERQLFVNVLSLCTQRDLRTWENVRR